jgi:hypothetical protein
VKAPTAAKLFAITQIIKSEVRVEYQPIGDICVAKPRKWWKYCKNIVASTEENVFAYH